MKLPQLQICSGSKFLIKSHQNLPFPLPKNEKQNSFCYLIPLGLTVGTIYYAYDSKQKSEKNTSELYQIHLKNKIHSMSFDEMLFTPKTSKDTQVAIGKLVQSVALPFYKESFPQYSGYRKKPGEPTIALTHENTLFYNYQKSKVEKKQTPARLHHGTMHAARVTLWTQVLAKVYEILGKEKEKNRLLLALSGAFHDVARENEGPDFWDTESSEILSLLLEKVKISKQDAAPYVEAIANKDPYSGVFSTTIQQIVHDADCLDIIRLSGEYGFYKNRLEFYHFDKEKKDFCDSLIHEIADFIFITENLEIKNRLEHSSENFYQDLLNLVFSMQLNEKPRFPLIMHLLKEEQE